MLFRSLNCGDQSGPNNVGIARARGSWNGRWSSGSRCSIGAVRRRGGRAGGVSQNRWRKSVCARSRISAWRRANWSRGSISDFGAEPSSSRFARHEVWQRCLNAIRLQWHCGLAMPRSSRTARRWRACRMMGNDDVGKRKRQQARSSYGRLFVFPAGTGSGASFLTRGNRECNLHALVLRARRSAHSPPPCAIIPEIAGSGCLVAAP